MSVRPSPFELWRQAGEDGARYLELLREHGHLVEAKPGESRNLPCGWPGNRPSTTGAVPVPSIDPLPSAVEVGARTIHAQALRGDNPAVTDRQILADWDDLSAEGRAYLFAEAQRHIEERAARPGEPDDLDVLLAKLAGDDERAAVEARLRQAADCE